MASGSGRTEVTNKFTYQVIGSVATPNDEDLELALASATRGAKAMATLPAHRRYEILHRTSELIAASKESFARTIAEEAGKPIKFSRAEVDRAAQTFQLAAEESRRIHGETLALDAVPAGENHFGFWWRKPVGVVVAIIAVSTFRSTWSLTSWLQPSQPATLTSTSQPKLRR